MKSWMFTQGFIELSEKMAIIQATYCTSIRTEGSINTALISFSKLQFHAYSSVFQIMFFAFLIDELWKQRYFNFQIKNFSWKKYIFIFDARQFYSFRKPIFLKIVGSKFVYLLVIRGSFFLQVNNFQINSLFRQLSQNMITYFSLNCSSFYKFFHKLFQIQNLN